MSPTYVRPKDGDAPRRTVVPTRYVADNAQLDELVKELKDTPYYAIDTEFHRERTYFAHLALLQVAWPNGIAIVDPFVVDIARFAEVLESASLPVLHAADQDLEVLQRACGCQPSAVFDTQIAGGFIGLSTPSLQSLVDRLLSVRLEKGDQLTDWTQRPLTDAQMRYAANDVAYLLELHDVLVARLSAAHRLEWAQEECALMLQRARGPVEPDQAWWRLKQARQFRGRERAIAQAVASWRESKAQLLDLPTRFVLSDLALVSIVHRPPTNKDQLLSVRNLDSRHFAGGPGEELLAAIGRGLELATCEVRVPPVPQGESVAKPAVTIAAAWVGERAHQLEIDPAILATRADLAAYLKDPPEGRLATSWRHDLIGEPIRRLVAGEASLALDANNVLVLESRSNVPLDLED